MIQFMTRVSRKPGCHSIYWVLDQAKNIECQLGVSVVYYHITHKVNVIPNNMAMGTLLYKEIVVF